MTVVMDTLPASIAQVLRGRGLETPELADAFLNPSLSHLQTPHAFGHMEAAVRRLLAAVRAEEPIAIYADRDVDGLTGLAILARTFRSLGGRAVWGSPVAGRGVERAVLERLLESGTKVMVLVDCGTGEHAELEWLAAQGVDVIVADHHRFAGTPPKAFAWIHPEAQNDAGRGTGDAGEGKLYENNAVLSGPFSSSRLPTPASRVPVPAGCVMAFKLAQAIWLSFLGEKDPERMDYFLYSHLDLVALGILADRVPLQGENRVLVWHGLRRLAQSRKAGLAALTRFFRLTPRTGPLTVREVTWQLIPLLNAAGRLGRPEVAAEMLITEDVDAARDCIDELLALNSQRRSAQDKSLACFEEAVIRQCAVESDPVLVAMAQDLEPSVTGLAAQALVRKYNRPVFLFVSQGEEAVGSGRGAAGHDLFAWIHAQQTKLLKYGGHQGAVGLTLRTADIPVFRQNLFELARQALAGKSDSRAEADQADVSLRIEAEIALEDVNELWWTALGRLAPYGMGHPMPLFQINGIKSIDPVIKKRSRKPVEDFILRSGVYEILAGFEEPSPPAPLSQQGEGRYGPGPWTVIGYPVADKSDRKFRWIIRDLWTCGDALNAAGPDDKE